MPLMLSNSAVHYYRLQSELVGVVIAQCSEGFMETVASIPGGIHLYCCILLALLLCLLHLSYNFTVLAESSLVLNFHTRCVIGINSHKRIQQCCHLANLRSTKMT